MDMKHEFGADRIAQFELGPKRVWQPESVAIAGIVGLLWLTVALRFVLANLVA